MGLEAATFVGDLTATNPVSTDKRKQGDDHLRLIKTTLKTTFPNASKAFYFDAYEAITGNETVAATDMNKIYGASTASGALTVTLPTSLVAADNGFTVTVVKLETNTNPVTVAPNSGTINGIASLSITNAGDRITAYWTGATWIGVVTLVGEDVVSITTNTTLDATHVDKLLAVVPASANISLTLPAASSFLGRVISVKLNSSAYTCTLNRSGGDTIDGNTSWVLSNQYEYIRILAVSGGWFVLAAQGAATGLGVPAGAGMDFWGATAPSGWLLCYGQAVSRTTYANLFTAIGTAHGAGNGSTTFNLPDKRGRVTAGKDDMGGSSANRLTNQSGGLNGDTLGATGGAETHTLTVAQMPAHTHSVTAAIVTGNTETGSGDVECNESSLTTGSTGGGGAHNNVQPTIIANYIIKY